MYKSDYKKQKEFEELILTGKYEEVIEYNNKNHYSVNVRKNKFNGIYNLAIRGDVELFKEFLSVREYGIKKFDNFDIEKFTRLIFKYKNFDLLREIINNTYDINFYFYTHIMYERRESFKRIVYSESLKKECPFEIFEFILNNIQVPLNNNYYNVEDSQEFRIIKKIIDNSKMEIFEKKIVEILKYKSFIEEYLIKYCLNKNKKNYIVKYLEILEDKEKIINLLTRIHTNSKVNLLKKFKNINGIKLNEKEKLEIAFYTKNKNLLKELINKTSEKDRYNILLNKIAATSEDQFDYFLENDKKNINELINKEVHEIIEKAFVFNNFSLIKYILKTTNEQRFNPKLFHNCAFINDKYFFEFMKDERLHYDNKEFSGLKLLINNHCLKKLDFVLKIDRIKKGININMLNKLFEEKKIDVLNVIANNIKKEEIKNYNNLNEEIKCFFRIKNF